jgi:TIGR03009 family protein
MPRAGLALVLVFAAVPAFGQAPQPPAGAPTPGGARIPTPGADNPAALQPGGLPQVDPNLLKHLVAWEGVMKNATNFYAEVTKVSKDQLLKKETTATGSVMCQKPNLARMRLDFKPAVGQKPGPNDYEAYICTGREIFQYDGPMKTVTKVQLRGVGVGDNLLLEFMSGTLKANDVLRRFDMRLLKEDANYIFLEVGAKLPNDVAEFKTMILVLHQPNIPGRPQLAYLPRTVVIRKNNNQQEESWDFPSPLINVKIEANAFQYVAPPQDWKVQSVQGPPAQPPLGGGNALPVARPKGP